MSVDTPIGAPYNIGQYSLLLHLMAQVTGMVADEFIWSTGDTHIYLNQLEQAQLQVTRLPKSPCVLQLNPDIKDIRQFRYDDISITGYFPDESINYAVNV